jgi:hypothetical protein
MIQDTSPRKIKNMTAPRGNTVGMNSNKKTRSMKSVGLNPVIDGVT